MIILQTTFDTGASLRWAWLATVLALATLYFLVLENGAVLGAGAETLHELFHDGRHFLGVPCH